MGHLRVVPLPPGDLLGLVDLGFEPGDRPGLIDCHAGGAGADDEPVALRLLLRLLPGLPGIGDMLDPPADGLLRFAPRALDRVGDIVAGIRDLLAHLLGLFLDGLDLADHLLDGVDLLFHLARRYCPTAIAAATGPAGLGIVPSAACAWATCFTFSTTWTALSSSLSSFSAPCGPPEDEDDDLAYPEDDQLHVG